MWRMPPPIRRDVRPCRPGELSHPRVASLCEGGEEAGAGWKGKEKEGVEADCAGAGAALGAARAQAR